MISLLQYAEGVPRKEEFIEYLRCFTGYDEHAEKRTNAECQDIYTDFENKYKEKMEYDAFADVYFWEFVRQRQLSQISDEECNRNERLLKHAIRKRVEKLNQTPMTFTEWKNFFNHEKESVSKWETNNSATFFEKEIWPIAEVSSKNDIVSLSKQTLADLIEMTYMYGKRNIILPYKPVYEEGKEYGKD